LQSQTWTLAFSAIRRLHAEARFNFKRGPQSRLRFDFNASL